jgi:Flp pilus assembly protein TadD
MAKGRLDEAITEYREALRIKKDFAKAHHNLGLALYDKGRLDEAIAAYREALRINKDNSTAHNSLGAALERKGRLDEAIAAYREALRINSDYAEAHYNLGAALMAKGRLDEAITEYREALRIKKDFAEAHCNLGFALVGKGRLEEAVAEYREALRIKKDLAQAHCNLGLVLRDKGQLAEALTHLRRGHELGCKNPRWPYPSAQWVKQCEQFVKLDAKLAKVLKGEVRPADVGERLALAQICQMYKHRYAAAVGFYTDAFAEQPKLADDLRGQPRYDAACAAALAGCGRGQDAAKLDTKERARLRRQALDWLGADLKAYRQLLDKSADKAGPAIAQRMQHWLRDADFAGVRGPDALANLPEAEKDGWKKLWAAVEELGKRAAGTK